MHRPVKSDILNPESISDLFRKKESAKWNIFIKRHWKVRNARVLEIANQAGDTMCRWLDAMIQRME